MKPRLEPACIASSRALNACMQHVPDLSWPEPSGISFSRHHMMELMMMRLAMHVM